MGFHHIGQAGLELLTSGDPPASASQSTGITGAHHHAWLIFVFLVKTGFACWPGWSWTPDFRWVAYCGLPKCWDYRHEPLCPVLISSIFHPQEYLSISGMPMTCFLFLMPLGNYSVWKNIFYAISRDLRWQRGRVNVSSFLPWCNPLQILRSWLYGF